MQSFNRQFALVERDMRIDELALRHRQIVKLLEVPILKDFFWAKEH
jgi:hypothetical protein